MGLLVPGLWFENSDLHSAQEYRLMLEALTGGRAGVWPSTSLVTETTGSERKVRVLGGRHYIWPRTQTHQGMGYAYNDGDVDLDIDAADPALPRIDLVIVEADDEETGGTVANTTQFRIVTGTPNASPSPPAVPDDAMALAEVEVAAAASVIVDADITDLPQLVTAVGGVRVCTSTTRPATPHEGMVILELDTGQLLAREGGVWTLPKNVSGGSLDYGERTTDIGPATFASSTDLDAALLVVSFTLASTRRIRITGYVRSVAATAASARVILQIRRASDNVVMEESVLAAHSAAGVGGRGGQVMWAPLLGAGSHSFKLSGLAADAASFTFAAATTYPAWILAEDIGAI